MSTVDVAAIRAALEKATPGPWAMGAYGPGQEHVAYTSPRAAEEGIEEHTVSAYVSFVKDEECQPNAELIVLLRNNAESLLDHGELVDRLAARIESQRDRALEALAEAERRGAVRALRAFGNQHGDRLIEGALAIDWAEDIESGTAQV